MEREIEMLMNKPILVVTSGFYQSGRGASYPRY